MSQLKDLGSEARDKELDLLFSTMPMEQDSIVELPSKGKFYKNFGQVKVRSLLFEDEQRILLSKSKLVNPINDIISSCTEGVNVQDLCLPDKVFLLLKIRELSYGEIYKFSIVCPACSENVDARLNIAEDLKINYAPDELVEPKEIKLPMLKATVKVRFPRVRDEIHLNDKDSLKNNLYRFIVSLNGNTDTVFISKALKRMHIRDIKTIQKEVNKEDFGVDSTFMFECPKCSHSSILSMPYDANFFSVA